MSCARKNTNRNKVFFFHSGKDQTKNNVVLLQRRRDQKPKGSDTNWNSHESERTGGVKVFRSGLELSSAERQCRSWRLRSSSSKRSKVNGAAEQGNTEQHFQQVPSRSNSQNQTQAD